MFTRDLLGLFLMLYDTCQTEFASVEAAILRTRPDALIALRERARADIADLYGAECELERVRDTTRMIQSWCHGRYGALGPFHLLSALDDLFADRRLEIQESAVRLLSRPGERAILPRPSFRFRPEGVRVARRRRPNICSYLHEFTVAVAPSTSSITYVPIGRDAPPRFRASWGAVNDALRAAQGSAPCLRVVCANFSRSLTDFIMRAAPAIGGWAETFGSTFWFERVNDAALEGLKEELRCILRQAVEIEAHVLVLPELTMPAALVAELESHLAREPFPILTVAGSWHVEDEGKERLNRTRVFAGSRQIATYDKICRFFFTGPEVDRWLSDPPYTLVLDGAIERGQACSEEIAAGSSLLVIDTDVGRFGLAICLDALVPSLIETYESLGVNYLLVPARSATIQRFAEGLKLFCEHCTAFLCFANTPAAAHAGPGASSFILYPVDRVKQILAGQAARKDRALDACAQDHAVLEPQDFCTGSLS